MGGYVSFFQFTDFKNMTSCPVNTCMEGMGLRTWGCPTLERKFITRQCVL